MGVRPLALPVEVRLHLPVLQAVVLLLRVALLPQVVVFRRFHLVGVDLHVLLDLDQTPLAAAVRHEHDLRSLGTLRRADLLASVRDLLCQPYCLLEADTDELLLQG